MKQQLKNPAYKIVYQNTHGLLSDFYGHTVCRGYKLRGSIILLLGVVLLGIVIAAATGAVTLRLRHGMMILAIMMDVVILAIGILMMVYHRLMGQMALKNARNANGGMVPETNIYFGEYIEVIEGQSHRAYQLADVTAISMSNSAYYIMFGRFSGLLLPKNSFAKGDAESFGGWIRKQAPRFRNQ